MVDVMAVTTSSTSFTSSTATADPAAVIQELYAAFGRGDMPGMLAVIDPQVDWSVQVGAPGGERVPMFRNGRGHDAVAHYFSGVAELDVHVFERRAFHVVGDVVLVELGLDFTHRGTGKRVRLDEIHRFVVRDGKIVHYRPYCDTAAFIDLFTPA
jgi:ketosteroid isomerase-like protein